jgi:hypothetical protein
MGEPGSHSPRSTLARAVQPAFARLPMFPLHDDSESTRKHPAGRAWVGCQRRRAGHAAAGPTAGGGADGSRAGGGGGGGGAQRVSGRRRGG